VELDLVVVEDLELVLDLVVEVLVPTSR